LKATTRRALPLAGHDTPKLVRLMPHDRPASPPAELTTLYPYPLVGFLRMSPRARAGQPPKRTTTSLPAPSASHERCVAKNEDTENPDSRQTTGDERCFLPLAQPSARMSACSPRFSGSECSST
jgi:hypothetical protein